METYYGTKRIEAQEMPGNQNKRDGYAVQYSDGYVSWSPKEAFEKAYRKSGDLTFGHALTALKESLRVARRGWNGKGMFLWVSEGSESVRRLPYICMVTADGYTVPWTASQTDMLAEDWYIID